MIVLDFSNMEKPEQKFEDEYPLDTALSRAHEMYKINKKWGCYMETDRSVYGAGEEILVTLYNKAGEGAQTIYLYPSDEEALRPIRAYNLFEPKELKDDDYNKNAVSRDPLIHGFFQVSHEDLYSLTFYGIPEVISSKFDLNPFEKSLEPGEEFKFKIIPPKVKGYYVIYAFKWSHDPDGIGTWGLNKSSSSNVFEIR